jgi:hypothetical protein
VASVPLPQPRPARGPPREGLCSPPAVARLLQSRPVFAYLKGTCSRRKRQSSLAPVFYTSVIPLPCNSVQVRPGS